MKKTFLFVMAIGLLFATGCGCKDGKEGLLCMKRASKLFKGTYTSIEVCSGNTRSYDLTISQEKGNPLGVILEDLPEKMFGLEGEVFGQIEADGTYFNIPDQVITGPNEAFTISGSGDTDEAGKSLTLTITHNRFGMEWCTFTMTKQ